MPVDILTGVRIPCGPWNARTCCGGEGAGAGHGVGTIPSAPNPGGGGGGGGTDPTETPSGGDAPPPGTPNPSDGTRPFLTQGFLGTITYDDAGNLCNQWEGYTGLIEVGTRSLWSARVLESDLPEAQWPEEDGSNAFDNSDVTVWEPPMIDGLSYSASQVSIQFGEYLTVGAVRIRVATDHLPVWFNDVDETGTSPDWMIARATMPDHFNVRDGCNNSTTMMPRVDGGDLWFFFDKNYTERKLWLMLSSVAAEVQIKDIRVYKYNTALPFAAPASPATAWAGLMLYPGFPRSTAEDILYTDEELAAFATLWSADGFNYTILTPVYGEPETDPDVEAGADWAHQFRLATATEIVGHTLPTDAIGWGVMSFGANFTGNQGNLLQTRLVAYYEVVGTGEPPVSIFRALKPDGSEDPSASLPAGARGWFAGVTDEGQVLAIPGWEAAFNRYYHNGL